MNNQYDPIIRDLKNNQYDQIIRNLINKLLYNMANFTMELLCQKHRKNKQIVMMLFKSQADSALNKVVKFNFCIFICFYVLFNNQFTCKG